LGAASAPALLPDGMTRRALRKVLGRALVHTHLLTAHLAKRTGSRCSKAGLAQQARSHA
jgi:hypothetical protein